MNNKTFHNGPDRERTPSRDFLHKPSNIAMDLFVALYRDKVFTVNKRNSRSL